MARDLLTPEFFCQADVEKRVFPGSFKGTRSDSDAVGREGDQGRLSKWLKGEERDRRSYL
jgi:hypothetical protein